MKSFRPEKAAGNALQIVKPRRDAALAQALLFIAAVFLIAWNVLLIIPCLAWILPTMIAIDLGANRGRTGWMWGAFLGWIGVIILACMRPVPVVPATPVRPAQ